MCLVSLQHKSFVEKWTLEWGLEFSRTFYRAIGPNRALMRRMRSKMRKMRSKMRKMRSKMRKMRSKMRKMRSKMQRHIPQGNPNLMYPCKKSYSSGSGCKTKTNHSELLKKQQVSHVNNSSLINYLHKSHARNDKYPSSLQFILSARQPKPITGKQIPLARAYSARAYPARAYSARAYSARAYSARAYPARAYPARAYSARALYYIQYAHITFSYTLMFYRGPVIR